MDQILEKLQVITDKLGNLDERLTGVEQKLQKKTKASTKSKNTKDVSQVHIFPFDESSEFVKMALIEDEQTQKEFYPVIEFLRVDFLKLANLLIHSQCLSLQWSDYTTSEAVAKFDNGNYILCN